MWQSQSRSLYLDSREHKALDNLIIFHTFIFPLVSDPLYAFYPFWGGMAIIEHHISSAGISLIYLMALEYFQYGSLAFLFIPFCPLLVLFFGFFWPSLHLADMSTALSKMKHCSFFYLLLFMTSRWTLVLPSAQEILASGETRWIINGQIMGSPIWLLLDQCIFCTIMLEKKRVLN